MQELYRWIAQTKDDKVYQEYLYKDSKIIGAKGRWEKEDAFEDVMEENQKGNIEYFMLEPMVKDVGLKSIAVKLGGKRKLIFWRKRIHKVDPEITMKWTLHVVGWEENVKGTSIKHKLFIYPNGNVETNNDEPTLVQAYMDANEDKIKEAMQQLEE